MPLIAIVIPCFNEERRLVPAEIINFLRLNVNYHFIFVNDGSTDNTSGVINHIKDGNVQQVTNLTLKVNRGKANAVREGILLGLSKKKYAFIGYWDADLSTNLEELLRIAAIALDQKLEFVFGSRMKKLNTNIERSGFRHIAGRIITTIIDSHFSLGIYDTQCGAKLFSAAMAEIISKEAFVTNWLFDVEIFLRIKRYCPEANGEEIPLLNWTSRRGSKLNILNAPGLVIEILKLRKNYPKKQMHG